MEEGDLAEFEEPAEQAQFAAFAARVLPLKHQFAQALSLSHQAAQVARAPAQCLRYSFIEGGEPLLPLKNPPLPSSASIPSCERCGSPRHGHLLQRLDSPNLTLCRRRFEFQVMPQLLNFLGQDSQDPHALDFGSICVFRCARRLHRSHSADLDPTAAPRAVQHPAEVTT